jgi:hypothetical protein
MNKKFLYIVDHYVPFPQSEYGGLWNVIAQDDDECFDLITAEEGGFYQNYYNRLKENVIKARRLEIDCNEESGIVEEFIT